MEPDEGEVEVEVGERLVPFPAPFQALEHMEEAQPMDLACNNYHMKQFLEALLRSSSAQRKEEVVQHLVRGLEGRSEDTGVAVSSVGDIHGDWYGEDTGSDSGQCLHVKPWALHKQVGQHNSPFIKVHRSNKPIICKGCRRTFTTGLSPGLRRFGLCDGCTCVTTTHEEPLPTNLSLVEAPSEGQDRGDPDTNWPIYVESGEENDPGEDEDGDDKQGVHRSLSDRETLM
ncbi:zinc finger and BTB domain containing 8B [Willisornis vidua]|uniref:Zinc finger and BTB domain containing 8B n=1 Tax=Willisornis vidua TaxID=1566151 RepID=A0ABQ9DE01_9PASS|nr:zinc finger and BTB domain containing 8B [Willisornis vidua]